jgi:transcriptional regulator with XRE-family HTH domain
MGTSQATISKIESGRTVPSLKEVDRFARAIGRPVQIVFGQPESPASKEELRRRVEKGLGADAFNPWDRDPTSAEQRSLIADGLARERFTR